MFITNCTQFEHAVPVKLFDEVSVAQIKVVDNKIQSLFTDLNIRKSNIALNID